MSQRYIKAPGAEHGGVNFEYALRFDAWASSRHTPPHMERHYGEVGLFASHGISPSQLMVGGEGEGV